MVYLLSSVVFFFFFSSRRRHTRYWRDWSSDVCSSDLRSRARRGGARARHADDARLRASRRDGAGGPRAPRVDPKLSRRGRSEERHVGKEGRARWSPEHQKKKHTYHRLRINTIASTSDA